MLSLHTPTQCEGDREILAELNRDAYDTWEADWNALTEEEQEDMLEDTRREIDEANAEAAFYWAVEVRSPQQVATANWLAEQTIGLAA